MGTWLRTRPLTSANHEQHTGLTGGNSKRQHPKQGSGRQRLGPKGTKKGVLLLNLFAYPLSEGP